MDPTVQSSWLGYQLDRSLLEIRAVLESSTKVHIKSITLAHSSDAKIELTMQDPSMMSVTRAFDNGEFYGRYSTRESWTSVPHGCY